MNENVTPEVIEEVDLSNEMLEELANGKGED